MSFEDKIESRIVRRDDNKIGYDSSGREIYAEVDDKRVWTEYDDEGNVIHSKLVYEGGRMLEMWYNYDEDGKKTYERHDTGNINEEIWYEYHDNGEIAEKRTNLFGKKLLKKFDKKGREIYEKGLNGGITIKRYDDNDNVIYIKHNSLESFFEYDDLSRLVYLKDENGVVERYKYEGSDTRWIEHYKKFKGRLTIVFREYDGNKLVYEARKQTSVGDFLHFMDLLEDLSEKKASLEVVIDKR